MDSLKLSLNIEFLLGSSSRKITQVAYAKQCLIYVCGCYIVFYSPYLDEQVGYLKHRNSNISAVGVSPDESLLAIAQNGKYPCIYVYSTDQVLSMNNSVQFKPLNILKGHKQSIDLIKFSPNSKYLVSIGNSDGSMFIWEKGESIAKNKLSKPVNVLHFDWNQDLLTVGNGYIKLWKFDNGNILRKKQGQYWMIQGKPISLGKTFSTRNYVDSKVFQNKDQHRNQKLILLSSEGFLCTISRNYDKIQKWVDLMMQNTSSLQIYGNLALCAGDNSLIKIFDLVSLSLRGKFPKPPPLNKQNITKDEQLQVKQDEKFPKCQGMLIFQQFTLTLYENSTMFVWSMNQDIKAFRSIITHRQKINCLCLLEQIQGDICFFGTASQDNTLRIWHFYKKCYENNRESVDIAQIIGIKRNAYCKNLTRIIYTDSQHPIIQVKIFMKKYIVCISKRQFLMYSLQTFNLILHENFTDQFKSVSFKNPDIILSLQTSQDLVYIGFQNGFLKVYKPSEQNLLKLKQTDFGEPINHLNLINEKKILIQGKSKAIIYDFQSNGRTSFNGVIKSSSTDKYIFLAEDKKIIYYSLIKNRRATELSLLHEFEADQKIKLIKNNSNLVILISTKDRLIIANFSATIIYSELMNQQITDVALTETGQLILTGREGDIVIKVISDSKYKKIQERAKKWFQLNDMSWMDNSIWASREINSHSNIKNRLTDNSVAKVNRSQTLVDIDRAKSINLDNILGDQSIQNRQMPSVEYEYKNQENKMSIFNPSNIYKQANQIYNNVNGLMKNLGGKANQRKNINFSGDINDDMFKSSNSAVQKEKKRIFQEEKQYCPKFTNNLVQSQMAEIQQADQSKILNEKKTQQYFEQEKLVKSKSHSPNSPSCQKPKQSQTLFYSAQLGQLKDGNVNNSMNSLKISESKPVQQSYSNKQDEIIHTLKEIIEVSRFGEQNIDHQYLKSLVGQHSQDFKKIYFVLNKIFGQNQKSTQQLQTQRQTQVSAVCKEAILQEYKKMSQNYLNFLQKNL